MVVTIDCRDTINCKVTIVLCNMAQTFCKSVVSDIRRIFSKF